jgi:hypothetical protein
MILEWRQAGCNLSQIAQRLASDGIRTAAGGQWTPTAVRNILARIAA